MNVLQQIVTGSIWIGYALFAAADEGGRLLYDPLAVPQPAASDVQDMDVNDASRDRIIPIKVYLPAEKRPAPVVLFSHGLGGSREGSAYLGRHWAARGYVAVFPALPPGSKYELVLFNTEHSAFTDRRLPGDTEPRNPNHYRAILALSTPFGTLICLTILPRKSGSMVRVRNRCWKRMIRGG